MAQGKLQHTVSNYRAKLQQHEQQAEKDLLAAYAHVLQVVQPQINALYQKIIDKQANGEDIPVSWLYESNRLLTLESLISGKIDQFAAFAKMQVGSSIKQMVALGQMSAQELLASTVPVGVHYSFGVPSQSAIADIIGSTQSGSPLDDLFQGFGSQAASDVKKALIAGISLGDNPRTIAPQIQQALDIPRWRALTISRTEMLRAYRSSQLANFQANSDVLNGWVWQSALDKRTCAACIAMSGTFHELSEDMETHPNCRCAALPETKSWNEILGRDDLDEEDSESLPTGSDWFDQQDEATQRAILGYSKYEAWSAGKFSLQDVVGHSHSDTWGGSMYEKPLKALV